jgi:hypothetical protein
VSFPIKHGDFHSYVSLPEGKWENENDKKQNGVLGFYIVSQPHTIYSRDCLNTNGGCKLLPITWRCPKMQVPQIIKNWTILVLKPMVLGIPHFKKPLKWENGSKLLKEWF